MSPSTLRSVVAVVLLAFGAITLIALFLPAGGLLNGYVDSFLRPLFGQGAWLLGVLLLVAGVLVERAPKVDYSWVTVALGGLIVFVGGEGLIHLLSGKGSSPADLEQGGGTVGSLLAATLSDLISPAGAFVVLVAIVLVGLLLLFDITLVAFVSPFARAGRSAAGAAGAGAASAGAALRSRSAHDEGPDPVAPVARSATAMRRRGPSAEPAPDLPEPLPSPAPVSQTVWAGSAWRVSGSAGGATVGATGATGARSARPARPALRRLPVRRLAWSQVATATLTRTQPARWGHPPPPASRMTRPRPPGVGSSRASGGCPA